ncbi:MAG: DNA-3-methyladenine glycosylase, partial [Solirubrobacteraceae bacterium]
PLDGIEVMRARRRVGRDEELCNGPGKLTQALGIGLDLNRTSLLDGPIRIEPRAPGWEAPVLDIGKRIGITKAVDLDWRFCARGNRHVSRPWPPRAHAA